MAAGRPSRWHRIACRLGLHIMRWQDPRGWRCACGRKRPWTDRLSRGGD